MNWIRNLKKNCIKITWFNEIEAVPTVTFKKSEKYCEFLIQIFAVYIVHARHFTSSIPICIWKWCSNALLLGLSLSFIITIIIIDIYAKCNVYLMHVCIMYVCMLERSHENEYSGRLSFQRNSFSSERAVADIWIVSCLPDTILNRPKMMVSTSTTNNSLFFKNEKKITFKLRRCTGKWNRLIMYTHTERLSII